MSESFDVISYAGEISIQGYEAVCEALSKKSSTRVILILATPGGDPHAGFRIARALQHHYEKFDALVPRYCKSAGTLILVGASELYLDDMSELGPLDIQIKKGDELIGRNSGLDIFKSVEYLQLQSMNAFRNYLWELTREAGLSTRVASDIASKLTSGLFEPIAAQIDPIKLAEMQRATEIAFEYGERLNAKFKNLRSGGMQKLVTGYPSHGFVIDRKEARSIFIKVSKPEGFLASISAALRSVMEQNTFQSSPAVQLFSFPQQQQKDDAHEDTSNTEGSSGGSPDIEPEVDGDCAHSDAPTQEGTAGEPEGAGEPQGGGSQQIPG